MARLFSSKRIAPGVRMSMTARGLRAHVGPRVARVHVGGGRTGVSTGAGPFTLYESVGRGSRAPANQQDRAAAANAARDALDAVWSIHRAPVSAPTPEVAVKPTLPKFGLLLATAEKQETKGLRLWDREARRAARGRARQVAEHWAIDLLAKATRDHRADLERIESTRRGLQSGDADAIRAALAAAFDTPASPAHLLGTRAHAGDVVVRAMPAEHLPTIKPATTASGAPTVARMNKTELAETFRAALGGLIMLTARHAFAVVPGLDELRVVGVDSSGRPLVATTLRRQTVEYADLSQPGWALLERMDPVLVVSTRGRSRELAPIDLAGTHFADLASSL